MFFSLKEFEDEELNESHLRQMVDQPGEQFCREGKVLDEEKLIRDYKRLERELKDEVKAILHLLLSS